MESRLPYRVSSAPVSSDTESEDQDYPHAGYREPYAISRISVLRHLGEELRSKTFRSQAVHRSYRSVEAGVSAGEGSDYYYSRHYHSEESHVIVVHDVSEYRVFVVCQLPRIYQQYEDDRDDVESQQSPQVTLLQAFGTDFSGS